MHPLFWWIDKAQLTARRVHAKCRIKRNHRGWIDIAVFGPAGCRKSESPFALMSLEQTPAFRHNATPRSSGDIKGGPRWSPRDDKL